MGSWDRFQIPLPFSRVVARYGEPILLDPKGRIEEQRRRVERQMNRLNHDTDGEAREARCSAWIARGAALGALVRSLPDVPFLVRNLFRRHETGEGFLRGKGKGCPDPNTPGDRCPVWVHADSAAEVPAMLALADGMRMGGSGSAEGIFTCARKARSVEKEPFGEAVVPIPFPLDRPPGAGWVVRRIRPRLFVGMRTGIGPYFLFLLGKRRIPVALVHGQISWNAVRRNRRFRFFYRRVFAQVSLFGMQSRRDALRMILAGADPRRVFVTGNLNRDGPGALAGTLRMLEPLWTEERIDA
jgi:3-deoxy-D-manno-octulosonic-acid transferase